MKLLLVLLLGVAGGGEFASNLAVPIGKLIGRDKAYLARSVHKMVASGYRLYSGNLPYENTYDDDYVDILIYQDRLRDGSRIYARSKDVTMRRASMSRDESILRWPSSCQNKMCFGSICLAITSYIGKVMISSFPSVAGRACLITG